MKKTYKSRYREAFPTATRVHVKWIRSLAPFTSTSTIYRCLRLFPPSFAPVASWDIKP